MADENVYPNDDEDKADFLAPAVDNVEMHVLGAIIKDNSCLHLLRHLKSEHFTHPTAQIFFEVMCDLQEAERPISPETIAQSFPDDQKIICADALAECERVAVDKASVRAFSDEIVLAWRTRAIAAIGQHIASGALEPRRPKDQVEFLSKSFEEFSKLARLPSRRVLVASVETGLNVMTGCIEHINSDDDAIEISTGFKKIDAVTLGLRRSELTVIGGATGMGKSILAHNIAANVAAAGKNVGYFSFEMPPEEMTQRLLARYTDYTTSQWKNRLTCIRELGQQHVIPDLQRTVEYVSERHKTLYHSCIAAPQYKEILPLVSGLVEEMQLDLVIFDHVALIPNAKGETHDANTIASAVQQLKATALACDIPIIGVAQLRKLDPKKTKFDDNGVPSPPTGQELLGSSQIAAAANNVLLVHRPAYYMRKALGPDINDGSNMGLRADYEAERHKAHIVLDKIRDGDQPALDLYFNEINCAFQDTYKDTDTVERLATVIGSQPIISDTVH